MRLIVLRTSRNGTAILGSITLDGLAECLTAELAGVEIPVGTYPVSLTESAHLGRLLPLLGNVPGRVGIRIHSINKVSELEGCVGVGQKRTSDGQGFEYPARPAEESLVSKIQAAINRGEPVTCEIQEAPEYPSR